METMTLAQRKSANDVAERWQRWIDDSDHNPAPSRYASVTRLRAWKARQRREAELEGTIARIDAVFKTLR